MKKTLFLTAALLGASFLLSAMPYLPGKSVKVDADLSDPVWKTLPWKGSFYALGTKEKAPVQSRFKTFHDKKYIYFDFFESNSLTYPVSGKVTPFEIKDAEYKIENGILTVTASKGFAVFIEE